MFFLFYFLFVYSLIFLLRRYAHYHDFTLALNFLPSIVFPFLRFTFLNTFSPPLHLIYLLFSIFTLLFSSSVLKIKISVTFNIFPHSKYIKLLLPQKQRHEKLCDLYASAILICQGEIQKAYNSMVVNAVIVPYFGQYIVVSG